MRGWGAFALCIIVFICLSNTAHSFQFDERALQIVGGSSTVEEEEAQQKPSVAKDAVNGGKKGSPQPTPTAFLQNAKTESTGDETDEHIRTGCETIVTAPPETPARHGIGSAEQAQESIVPTLGSFGTLINGVWTAPCPYKWACISYQASNLCSRVAGIQLWILPVFVFHHNRLLLWSDTACVGGNDCIQCELPSCSLKLCIHVFSVAFLTSSLSYKHNRSSKSKYQS